MLTNIIQSVAFVFPARSDKRVMKQLNAEIKELSIAAIRHEFSTGISEQQFRQ
jgi:hypothetical protein